MYIKKITIRKVSVEALFGFNYWHIANVLERRIEELATRREKLLIDALSLRAVAHLARKMMDTFDRGKE